MTAADAATDTRQYPFPMTRGEAQAIHALVALEQERIVREPFEAEDEEGALAEWEALGERLELFIEGNFADEIAEEAQRYDEEDARRRRSAAT